MSRVTPTQPALLAVLAAALLLACGDSSGDSSSTAPEDTVADTAPSDTTVEADTGVIEDTAPAGPPCNPYSKDGCVEGEKCAFDTQDEIACLPAGTKPLGELCDGESEEPRKGHLRCYTLHCDGCEATEGPV